MEVRDRFRSMFELGGKNPFEFFIGAFVPSPMDLVQERTSLTTLVQLRVYNLGDLIFEVPFDFDRRRWSCYSSWNGTRNVRF